MADQKVPESIELIEVVRDASNGTIIKKGLWQSDQPIENGFSGVHVHPVGNPCEDQAARSSRDRLDNRGCNQNQSNADHTVEGVIPSGLCVDQAHDSQWSYQGQHVHNRRGGDHFDQFFAVGAEVGAVPAPAETLFFAVWPTP